MDQSSSRVVVITGAGSGLGRQMARRLLRDGHRVALAGRTASTLEEAADGSPNGLTVPTDVTSHSDVTSLFDRVGATWGRVDVLINNAGMFGRPGSVDQLNVDEWADMLAVNLTGPVLCAGEAMRRMKRQTPRGGRIINNGSLSAHTPRPMSAAYSVAKHGITGLTRSISLDGREFDISCTQIDIGNAATQMTARVAVEALQPDGSLRAEPTFDPAHVADAVSYLVGLPLDVSVPFLTMMANQMPFAGRG
jgi:NAD(P)-dependent dehydrogenase (short-subunit alcohol dehydrogenase family)